MRDDPVVERVAPVEVASPCILVCMLDTRTGWCLGCGRTGAEIAEWSTASDDRRRAILSPLPARLATMTARRTLS